MNSVTSNAVYNAIAEKGDTYSLILAFEPTTTSTNYNTYNSRKISDYKLIEIGCIVNNILVDNMIISTKFFKQRQVQFSVRSSSAIANTFWLTYISDTQIAIYKNNGSTYNTICVNGIV